MVKLYAGVAVCLCVLVAGCGGGYSSSGAGTVKGEPMLAHNVYFTLKDNSDSAKEELVNACHKYLKDHPGVVFFAAGTLAEELDRPVNDMEFDVGLHVVFKNIDYQNKYQTAEAHLQFIEENKENWEQVRVFDSKVR